MRSESNSALERMGLRTLCAARGRGLRDGSSVALSSGSSGSVMERGGGQRAAEHSHQQLGSAGNGS